jgi:hypothetical protein
MEREDMEREDMEREDMEREDMEREDMEREDMEREDMEREDMEREKKAKTYRFKFSPAFLEHLVGFTRIHKYDDKDAFKENWETWIQDNKEIINREDNRLRTAGYSGNILEKMYKSARYYFKNKSDKKVKEKKRKNYVGVAVEFRDLMDKHIKEICMRNDVKPSDGFLDFMDNGDEVEIRRENTRLKSYNFSAEDILKKLKKTYKNRYYIIQKNK